MPDLPILPDGRFVSYAQNAEDAVLLRVFREQPAGFWIDIGANHPINDSVTKNFSFMGWHGINVEPVASLYEQLCLDRPGEVNILAGVSDHSGTMTFHRNDSNLDLSTFHPGLAAGYLARGDDLVDVDIPVLTLAEICAAHVGDRSIDFIKIDTEGHELAVVEGHDFDRYRPRVLLAEVGEYRDAIREALQRRAMRPVLFDGVNEWYVHEDEDPDFVERLARPALAVLDWFHPNVYYAAMDIRDHQIRELQAQVADLERKLAAAEREPATPPTASVRVVSEFRRALRQVRRVLGAALRPARRRFGSTRDRG